MAVRKGLLIFPHKQIRAQAIKEYMERAGYERAVCFTCGNAADALAEAGVDVLHIGPRGDLIPGKWFTQADIHKAFPQYFDATSGHLPMELMLAIADRFRDHLQDSLGDVAYVPTGSGETLVCLKLAYPDKEFVAVYDLNSATEYSEGAPLNKLVAALAYRLVR